MSSNETFKWTLERFPDLRLATNIVENPRSLLATIFGTPLEDIPTTLGSVATYDAVFDAAQHCVVSIKKALIDKAIEIIRKNNSRGDAGAAWDGGGCVQSVQSDRSVGERGNGVATHAHSAFCSQTLWRRETDCVLPTNENADFAQPPGMPRRAGSKHE
jgi:hypothetical protein